MAHPLIAKTKSAVRPNVIGDDCGRAKQSMSELVDVFVDAVDAIEAGEDIRSTRLNTVWKNAAHFLAASYSDCYDDTTDLRFHIDDAAEVMDASRIRMDARQLEDDLREAIGRVPRRKTENCRTAALAAAEQVIEDCG